MQISVILLLVVLDFQSLGICYKHKVLFVAPTEYGLNGVQKIVLIFKKNLMSISLMLEHTVFYVCPENPVSSEIYNSF